MKLKKFLLIALLSFGIAQSALAETNSEKFDRAYQFIEQQNYSAAFPLFKQLAEQGFAKAQYNLGVMYE
ncbi:sel1 repeat family protein, partial [Actinobacillus seminis]